MAACDRSGSRPIFRSSCFRSARAAVFVSAPLPFISVLIAAGSAYLLTSVGFSSNEDATTRVSASSIAGMLRAEP